MKNKKASHTPGSWEVSLSEDNKSSGHYVTAPGHRSICKMTGKAWYGDCPMAHENLANARLIASAPELLKVCKEMYKILPVADPKWIEVLKKAEGGNV